MVPTETDVLVPWRGIAARARALSEGAAVADDVRCAAAATLDLLQLVATWPLPRASRFRIDLAASLFDLCESVGEALCAGRYCPQDRSSAGRACQAIAHPDDATAAFRQRSGA